jgi:hypothetical protein
VWERGTKSEKVEEKILKDGIYTKDLGKQLSKLEIETKKNCFDKSLYVIKFAVCDLINLTFNINIAEFSIIKKWIKT